MIGRIGITLFVALVCAAPASAYVQTRSTAGTPVRWPVRCVIITPDARGDQSDDPIAIDDVNGALSRAVNNWNSRVSTCTYMVVVEVDATRALEAVSDGRPSVVFRSDVWGRGDKTYDPSAIGITTVWFVDRPDDATDGQITDADIELNAVNYSFTLNPDTATARPGTKIADLENTLTHELGHVLGLAHTCWDHKTDTPPLDDQGNPAPDCDNGSALPAKVTGATMYPYVTKDGAINMRMLSQDDVNGVCNSYPVDNTPTACYGYIESTGCAFGLGERPKPFLIGGAFLLALASLLGRARRRGSV